LREGKNREISAGCGGAESLREAGGATLRRLGEAAKNRLRWLIESYSLWRLFIKSDIRLADFIPSVGS
jgi:hypothetical protein